MHPEQSPLRQFKQFEGQQYPDVNTYDEEQAEQFDNDVQKVHPVEQI